MRLTAWPPWGERVVPICVPGLSWRQRIVAFLVFLLTVGGVAGAVDALLGVFDVRLSLSFPWAVLAVAGCAVVAVLTLERVRPRRLIGTVSLVRFTVLITTRGTRLAVKAPRDLLVERFVAGLLDFLAKETTAGDDVIVGRIIPLYEVNLYVQRGSRYRKVANDKTLRETGVDDGDICKLRGYIRVEPPREVQVRSRESAEDARLAGTFRRSQSELRVLVVDNSDPADDTEMSVAEPDRVRTVLDELVAQGWQPIE